MKTFTSIAVIITLITLSTNLSADKLNIQCINQQLHLSIHTNQLHLTEDAIVDNTGGYVDIPEEKYYLKSTLQISKIKGKVTKNSKPNSSNLFQAVIDKKALTNIQENEELLLIQKIDLLENNQTPMKQNITTTNIIKLSFNSNDKQELQRCQK